MKLEDIQAYCHSLPGTIEGKKWGTDFIYSVGKKLYTILGMVENELTTISFKTTPDLFEQLIQHEDIIPASYAERYHWVMLKHPDVFEDDVIRSFIWDSYDLVYARLTKKMKKAIQAGGTGF